MHHSETADCNRPMQFDSRSPSLCALSVPFHWRVHKSWWLLCHPTASVIVDIFNHLAFRRFAFTVIKMTCIFCRLDRLTMLIQPARWHGKALDAYTLSCIESTDDNRMPWPSKMQHDTTCILCGPSTTCEWIRMGHFCWVLSFQTIDNSDIAHPLGQDCGYARPCSEHDIDILCFISVVFAVADGGSLATEMQSIHIFSWFSAALAYP